MTSSLSRHKILKATINRRITSQDRGYVKPFFAASRRSACVFLYLWFLSQLFLVCSCLGGEFLWNSSTN